MTGLPCTKYVYLSKCPSVNTALACRKGVIFSCILSDKQSEHIHTSESREFYKHLTRKSVVSLGPQHVFSTVKVEGFGQGLL